MHKNRAYKPTNKAELKSSAKKRGVEERRTIHESATKERAQTMPNQNNNSRIGTLKKLVRTLTMIRRVRRCKEIG